MDVREGVRAAARAMVQRIGDLEAAAATIAARFGGVANKATLSKKMSGALTFTVEDIVALEDALGAYPVTEALARRMSSDVLVRGCLLEGGAALAKEAGEAVAALMQASSSADAGDRARALQELSEARDALDRCVAQLEGRS